MAKVIVTLKIMPEDPEIDLAAIQEKAEQKITDSGGTVNKEHIQIEPVGFGLKAIILPFSIDENKGSPDPLAEEIAAIEGIRSAEVIMVSRALG